MTLCRFEAFESMKSAENCFWHANCQETTFEKVEILQNLSPFLIYPWVQHTLEKLKFLHSESIQAFPRVLEAFFVPKILFFEKIMTQVYHGSRWRYNDEIGLKLFAVTHWLTFEIIPGGFEQVWTSKSYKSHFDISLQHFLKGHFLRDIKLFLQVSRPAVFWLPFFLCAVSNQISNAKRCPVSGARF